MPDTRCGAVIRGGMIPAALMSLLLAGGAAEARHEGDGPGGAADWAYGGDKGPEHWADLSPAYSVCREGRAQSPIDIRGARTELGEPLFFRYRSNALTVVNDGRTIRVQYEPGSYIRVGSHRYELVQTDFHVPGEHRVNGVAADMVGHFLHQDTDGNLAVVEVPFAAGRRMNSVLTRIWDHLPDRPESSYYGRQVGINPTFMLPNDRSYFTYVGSLSTPPCNEGVRWFVFRSPVEVDAGYMGRLLNVTGPNARPVQPVNGRQVALQAR